MKNKKNLYFLIPLVLIVWGLIFYRIFTGIKDSPSDTRPIFINNTGDNKGSLTDTIKLIANYRDPFLSSSINVVPKQTNIGSGSIGNRHALSVNSNTVLLPDIQYFGIISNLKNKNKVGLIKFEGKDYLLKEGEFVSQIKVLKLFKDSILLSYQNHRHSIKRS